MSADATPPRTSDGVASLVFAAHAGWTILTLGPLSISWCLYALQQGALILWPIIIEVVMWALLLGAFVAIIRHPSRRAGTFGRWLAWTSVAFAVAYGWVVSTELAVGVFGRSQTFRDLVALVAITALLMPAVLAAARRWLFEVTAVALTVVASVATVMMAMLSQAHPNAANVGMLFPLAIDYVVLLVAASLAFSTATRSRRIDSKPV